LLGKKPPSNAKRHRYKSKSKGHGRAVTSIDANEVLSLAALLC